MILVWPYHRQKSHFTQPRTELPAFTTTSCWQRQAQSSQSASIYRSSSYFAFHRINYRLLQTFLSPASKSIALIFQLLPHLLQYFKLTSNCVLSKVAFVIIPLSNHYFFLYLMVNTMYRITELLLFRGKGIN